jgi:hypothetical protein
MVATVISDASTGDAHEGWWRLHGAFPTTAQPAASTTSDVPSTSASGDSRGDDSKNDAAVESLVGVSSPQFCRGNAALEGAVGSSQFNEVVGDGVRAAAANPDAATSNATLSSFVDSLSTQAPCFWARYTALPLPDGMNMSLCTHDPAVDTVMSAKIHTAGSWFEDSVWSDFGRMLVDGSCPPDRPVVLDLGLNIGYVREEVLIERCGGQGLGLCDGCPRHAAVPCAVSASEHGPRCRCSRAATSSPSTR